MDFITWFLYRGRDILMSLSFWFSCLLLQCIESILLRATYQSGKASEWNNTIIELCLKRLASVNGPFKYIVTSIITQKNHVGLHTACACYWDPSTDGHCTVPWENSSLHCIVSVFGLGL